jgi:hypothetical protein
MSMTARAKEPRARLNAAKQRNPAVLPARTRKAGPMADTRPNGGFLDDEHSGRPFCTNCGDEGCGRCDPVAL